MEAFRIVIGAIGSAVVGLAVTGYAFLRMEKQNGVGATAMGALVGIGLFVCILRSELRE